MSGSSEIPLPQYDPELQSEKLGFDPDEMIGCGECGRKNSPNRLSCIYCGTALPVDPTAAAITSPLVNKLDLRDRGFNLIISGDRAGRDADIVKAASILGLEKDILSAILNYSLALPIARVESETSAEEIRSILDKLGISSTFVSDGDLAPESPPKRLRRIELEGDFLVLTLFNSDEVIRVPTPDIVLLIDGVISISRADQVEKRRLRGARQIIDETSSISYENVVDIYTSIDKIGYRLQTTGFDFSSLEEKKVIVAADNLELLVGQLVQASPNVRRVENYKELRPLLGHVWEVETTQESLGLRRPTLGQKGFGSVTTSTNLNQFNKFSRLQRIFYEI